MGEAFQDKRAIKTEDIHQGIKGMPWLYCFPWLSDDIVSKRENCVGGWVWGLGEGNLWKEGEDLCVIGWKLLCKKKKASVLLVRSLIYAVVGLSWVHLFFSCEWCYKVSGGLKVGGLRFASPHSVHCTVTPAVGMELWGVSEPPRPLGEGVALGPCPGRLWLRRICGCFGGDV